MIEIYRHYSGKHVRVKDPEKQKLWRMLCKKKRKHTMRHPRLVRRIQ